MKKAPTQDLSQTLETGGGNSAIRENLAKVNSRIKIACQNAHRSSDSVHLLAVSKTKPASMVLAAMACGQRHFGENYLQDALPKIELINHSSSGDGENNKGDKGIWHFIGAIQSNKTRPIAEHFDWVHTVASLKVARRLNNQRPADKPPLKIFLQINIDDDPDKSGFHPHELALVLPEIATFERLELQGLMTLPTQRQGTSLQREPFKQLRLLQQANCPTQAELSIGMSQDLEAAILEGATWVRIGTDIFGTRESL